jgi:uncharacterized protein YjiS (DUF1127 family)
VPGSSELSRGLGAALLQAPTVLFNGLLAWQRQSEERAHLRRLTDYQLRDIGLTRSEAEGIARKISWSRRA